MKTTEQREECSEKIGTKIKSTNTQESLEIWKPIRGLEYYFQVSNHGRIKSRFKILKPRPLRGYLYIIIEVSDGEFRFRRNIPVHRLVAQEFIENRLERKEVNHKDGIKTNNNASNLEWMSRSENQRHAFALGLHKIPRGRMKFTREQIEEVFSLRKKDWKHKEIAKHLGMGVSTVTHLLLGTRRTKQ